jgi:hypothetical protein
MIDTIKSVLSAKIAVIFFVLFTLWFCYFHIPGVEAQLHYDWFTVTYGVMAAFGAVWGFVIAKKWGWIHSLMGKSIALFSLGLALQEFGQIGYTYYIYYLHVDVPYPSWGDIGFYGSIPCYTLAVWYMAKAGGIHISLRSFASKMQAIAIPTAMLLLSYFFFLRGYEFDWSHPLTVFLDIGVPIGQAVYISLAILAYTLTRGTLGGIMRTKVLFILFALLVQYISDWTFLYQASRGTWAVSGINDYMFFVSYFLMAFGLFQFDVIYQKLKGAN